MSQKNALITIKIIIIRSNCPFTPSIKIAYFIVFLIFFWCSEGFLVWPEWKPSLNWSRTEYAQTVRPKGHVVWLGLYVFNNKIWSSGTVTPDSFEYYWNREYSAALSSTGADHLWKHVLFLWVSTSGSSDLSTPCPLPHLGSPRPPPQPGAVSPCPSEAIGVLGFSYPQLCPVTGLTQPGPHMDLYFVLAWTCLAWTSCGQSPTPGLRCPRASCCHAPDWAEGRALAAGPALIEPRGAPIVPAGPWHWQIQVMWYWAFFPQKDTPC